MARFTLPRDLYHGKGALEALKSFTGKKAMICVGGGSMKRFGFLDRAVGYLKEAGMEVELFEGIEPDPSVETVMRGAEAMLKFEPDWIIAMGGGSPIDAAKAMWIKYEYPEITFEEMCKVFGIPPLRRKAHFCAISSTSGTATEVTAFSIITDYQKGIKYPIADFEITPDVAIVDPDLAETMPKKLVAHTGMDAMTHAIEAYVSTAHCDYTDPLAIFAIRMIQGDLVDSYNGDMSKRDSMHNAQCLAGMAFSNALLGIVHSMAHKTGAAFADYGAHIIHGAANAMYLPDPSVETVMRGAEAMLKFEPDWIIAMGGGSPIDAAKAMWIKYEYPEITFEEMCKVFGIPPLRRKAHFCAISSTSGTATEVTAFSIITDYQKGIKYPIADFEITPDVAIVDPDLAETMPKKLVAHTGMDAMTHAIEAYVSTAHCDYTDPLAIFAIRMIQGDLVDSYNGDMSKRDSMHNAQCLAGMAFSNALLGIVHSMAHKTGAAFADYGAHIIHGAANAMYLPKVIAFNAKDPEAKKRYGVIADEMKLGGSNDDEKVKLLIEYLRGMNDALNIPHCIKNYGPDSYPTEQGFVPEEVFLERLPEIAKNAIGDACTGSNPRQPSQEEMEKLLKCCYYDTEVDF